MSKGALTFACVVVFVIYYSCEGHAPGMKQLLWLVPIAIVLGVVLQAIVGVSKK